MSDTPRQPWRSVPDVGSALNAGVAGVDVPDLLFVSRLGVVVERRSRHDARGPAELEALLGVPAVDDAVEDIPDMSCYISDTMSISSDTCAPSRKNRKMRSIDERPFQFDSCRAVEVELSAPGI